MKVSFSIRWRRTYQEKVIVNNSWFQWQYPVQRVDHSLLFISISNLPSFPLIMFSLLIEVDILINISSNQTILSFLFLFFLRFLFLTSFYSRRTEEEENEKRSKKVTSKGQGDINDQQTSTEDQAEKNTRTSTFEQTGRDIFDKGGENVLTVESVTGHGIEECQGEGECTDVSEGKKRRNHLDLHHHRRSSFTGKTAECHEWEWSGNKYNSPCRIEC